MAALTRQTKDEWERGGAVNEQARRLPIDSGKFILNAYDLCSRLNNNVVSTFQCSQVHVFK
jgi:hypothetical protein